MLNGKKDVSSITRKRIEKKIKKLGYNPSGIARGLVLQKTNTIGLIIPDVSNPFFPEVIKGIEKKCKDIGYSLILYDTDNDIKEEEKAINLLRSKQVDGIILSLSQKNKNILKKLEEKNYPIVQIDRKIKNSKYPAVIINNEKSAYTATNYLIKQGHTKIGHITGNLNTETANNRLNGFKKAMKQNNLSLNKKWILEGDYSKDSGSNNMRKIIDLKDRPTALFIANDLMAFGAYETIYKCNYNIPNDFSIIGHDNINITSFVRPMLTTMDQPKFLLGQIAVQKLENIIEKKEDNIILEDTILKNKIVIRESVKNI